MNQVKDADHMFNINCTHDFFFNEDKMKENMKTKENKFQ